MKEGEMLLDLVRLFAKLDTALPDLERESTKLTIKMCHALPWYDGDPLEDEPRWQVFSQKVDVLIKECHANGWHKDPHILSEKWVEGVLDIDECHDDVPFLEKLNQKDIVRHWLNGGTHFGIAENIRKQMDEIIKQDKRELMERVEKRFNDHSDA